MSNWIKHTGNACPVDSDELVYCRFKDGSENSEPINAGFVQWSCGAGQRSGWAVREYRLANAKKSKTADEFLDAAKAVMSERGKEYDSGSGERSMSATVRAFNAITLRDQTGVGLSESEGWLFMLLLKQVRQSQAKGYHADSAQDSVAYAALLAESQAGEL